MPHLILEASANIMETNEKIRLILKECHNILVNKLPTKAANCKSRAILHDIYVLGDNQPTNAFVHLTVKVLKGRSPELLATTSKELQTALNEGFSKSLTRLKLGVSVEICELNDSYAPFV